MLKTLHFRQFRSLRDLRLLLHRLTVITGENGVGKCNVYRALSMLQRLAAGRFAEAIAHEGGMPSLLWSGDRQDKKPLRATWKIEHDLFTYEMECGLIPATPGDPTAFRTDPKPYRPPSPALSGASSMTRAASTVTDPRPWPQTMAHCRRDLRWHPPLLLPVRRIAFAQAIATSGVE